MIGRKTKGTHHRTCKAEKKTHFDFCIPYRSPGKCTENISTIHPLLIKLTFTLGAILKS